MGIITISRGSFSRGKEIAEKLSQKLGYECISREILLEASEEFNVPEIKLNEAIHDAPSIFNRLKNGKKKYTAFIREAFLNHIQNDNVIYHGLAGHFFARGIPGILKVRITADIDFRIKMVMKNENVSEEKAYHLLNKIDDERRSWSMYLYGIDNNSTELYDVVLRINCLGAAEGVETLYKIAQRPCFKITPESQKRITDKLLAAKVYAALVDTFPDAIVKTNDGIAIIAIEASLSAEDQVSKNVKNLVKNIEGIREVRTSVIPIGYS
jgi:cytidylate kinase